MAGLYLGVGLVPLAGETLRHTVYGLALSTSYTLLTCARAPRAPTPAVAETQRAPPPDL